MLYMETIIELENKNIPREHNVNIILENNFKELRGILKQVKIIESTIFLLILIGCFSPLYGLLLHIYFLYDLSITTSTLGIGMFSLVSSYLIFSFSFKRFDNRINDVYFDILVFLNDYSKIHKTAYYISKENNNLLHLAEKRKLNNITKYHLKILLIGFFAFFVFVYMSNVYTSYTLIINNLKKIQTLEQENKILKEKLEKYEKKQK